MNNEETIIMQPQGSKKAEEVKNTVETPATEPAKEEKKSAKGKKVAATVAAAAMGGAVGGAGTVAAANYINTEKEEAEVVEDTASVATPVAETKPEPELMPEPEPTEEKEDIIETIPEDSTEPDYTNENGADPVTPQPDSANNDGNEGAGEVIVLGIDEGYTEDGTHIEAAYLTDGETIAAVVDYDGDGEANIIAIDENHNNEIEENEIYDIAEEHVDMDVFEQQYLAQQEAEMQQQDTFAYSASDETDYNNDVEVYDA